MFRPRGGQKDLFSHSFFFSLTRKRDLPEEQKKKVHASRTAPASAMGVAVEAVVLRQVNMFPALEVPLTPSGGT